MAGRVELGHRNPMWPVVLTIVVLALAFIRIAPPVISIPERAAPQAVVVTDIITAQEMPAVRAEIQVAVGKWLQEGNTLATFSADHALSRHGQDAVVAAQAICSGGFQRWRCNDGRDRNIKNLAPNKWAVVVADWDQFLTGLSWQSVLDICVTAFIADQDYIKKITEPCKNSLEDIHP